MLPQAHAAQGAQRSRARAARGLLVCGQSCAWRVSCHRAQARRGAPLRVAGVRHDRSDTRQLPQLRHGHPCAAPSRQRDDCVAQPQLGQVHLRADGQARHCKGRRRFLRPAPRHERPHHVHPRPRRLRRVQVRPVRARQVRSAVSHSPRPGEQRAALKRLHRARAAPCRAQVTALQVNPP
eukprot:Amastigsp_a843456_26.p3 type:complete len:180 gc:universal Amastigsp_a843456_26:546-7(-)